jgi:creatinine amidohydrolase/Fe(II)-dependent formamide hydrolase-like protein
MAHTTMAAPFPPGRVLAHPEVHFPSGVLGDPTRATAQAGIAVLDHVVRTTVEMLTHATVSTSPGPV